MANEGSYTDRYPEVRGRLLWCVDCGADCAAENLDWGQHCPRCARWWRDNPPPTEPPAPAANPATTDARAGEVSDGE